MSAYELSLWLSGAAFIVQTLVAGLGIEIVLRRDAAPPVRRIALAAAVAALLLSLTQGYALELALRTGIYDLRTAGLHCVVALLQLWVGRGLLRLGR
ncbi:hypothetical protein VX159_00565 [Dechloromonas sp. ZY10]|uniref:hypothetical protein n=1 Tax=Dechloromonas aquae TaxID=2664436 RepID=UPI003526E1A8